MSEQPRFTCTVCGTRFTMKPETLAKYPGWVPAKCWKCNQAGKRPKNAGGGATRPQRRQRGSSKEQNLTTAQVLERYEAGPTEGVFTDGACTGNPGPGGWGAVWVKDGEAIDQRHGHEAQTTNNRMELTALIAAYEMLPRDEETTIYSDSNLCVQTINQWAAGWKRNGWQRGKRGKGKPVKNLELVKKAYHLSLARPLARLEWIKAHDGSRWNEYADSLATAYLRDEV